MIYVNKIYVNPDHVHIFLKYPPKYSLSYIAKKIKGVSSRILRKEFPPPSGMVWRTSLGAELFPWVCGAGMGCCGKVYS
jgi:REP element-mobilizing transposase RayT